MVDKSIKRLIKQAEETVSEVQKIVMQDTPSAFNVNTAFYSNILKNIANEGREVLKTIENYKFKLNQSKNAMNGNQQLLKKLEQKEKIIDNAAVQIYSIVFDLENIDIMPEYDMSQLSLGPTFKPQDAETNDDSQEQNDDTSENENKDNKENETADDNADAEDETSEEEKDNADEESEDEELPEEDEEEAGEEE